MRCPSCHEPDQKQGEQCLRCGKDIVSPGERAQALATLVQSQDSITWVAFSLAMTLESVLLVGFYELDSKVNTLGIAGLVLATVFLVLVTRSNHDMTKYYIRGKDEYPSIFHYERTGFWEKLVFGVLKARIVMSLALGAWISGWLWLLLT